MKSNADKLLSVRFSAEPDTISLTFDDGPDSRLTPQLLDILSKYDVKATFFVVGRKVQAYSEVARRICEQGHTLGNHSMTHFGLFGQSYEAVMREISTTNDLITELTGHSPRLFRPPYGRFGFNVIRALRETGQTLVLWNASVRDYSPRASTGWIEQRLNKVVRPGKIVLLHDGHANSANMLVALESHLQHHREARMLSHYQAL